MDFPQVIDLEDSFQKGATLSGVCSSRDMSRLTELLNKEVDTIEYTLTFERQGQHNVIHCVVTTCLDVLCQRCNEEMVLPIQLDSYLCVITSDALSKKVPKKYEPFVVDTGSISVLDLLEDELLLGIPMIPRHESLDCSASLSKTLIN